MLLVPFLKNITLKITSMTTIMTMTTIIRGLIQVSILTPFSNSHYNVLEALKEVLGSQATGH